jgi:Fe-Mn family superoxide dismutase
MPTYVLPDLDYDFGALEPHISARIMELHHGQHHKGYVAKANEILEHLEEARAKGHFESIGALEGALAFHVSGHVLHSIFWKNLTPDGGGVPNGDLALRLARDFGSFASFKSQLTETAATLMGAGWAALVFEPLSKRLVICQIHDHQANATPGAVPLMVIDAWEHAYYLQYENRKGEFFKAVWNLWNWEDIHSRLVAAQKLVLESGRVLTAAPL